jgi:hypothetical protein
MPATAASSLVMRCNPYLGLSDCEAVDVDIGTLAGAFGTGFGGVAGGASDLASAFTAEGAGSIAQRPGMAVGGTTSLGVAGMEGIDSLAGNYFSEGISTFTDSAGRAQQAVDNAQAALDSANAEYGFLQAAADGDNVLLTGGQDAADDAWNAAVDAEDALAQAEATKAKADKATKWDCPILKAAAVVHTSLSLFNGIGPPNRGTDLGSAAKDLNTALDNLDYAGRTRGWDGPASEAYVEANRQQIADVESLKAHDLEFKAHLEAQANEVLDLRQVFGYVRTTIMLAQPVASALNAAGLFAQSTAFQTTVALTCLSTDTSHQGIQHENAVANRGKFEALTEEYGKLPNEPKSAEKPDPTSILNVDPDTQKELAAEQDKAANRLGDSVSSVPDWLGRNVKNTHGAVCTASHPAVQKAQNSRAAAAKRLQDVSTALAGKVRTAQGWYWDTDTNAGQSINKEM